MSNEAGAWWGFRHAAAMPPLSQAQARLGRIIDRQEFHETFPPALPSPPEAVKKSGGSGNWRAVPCPGDGKNFPAKRGTDSFFAREVLNFCNGKWKSFCNSWVIPNLPAFLCGTQVNPLEIRTSRRFWPENFCHPLDNKKGCCLLQLNFVTASRSRGRGPG